MLKNTIINSNSKNNFYRRILLITASFYLIYFLFFKLLSIEDRMFIDYRILTILLYLSVYFLSYKVEWINNRLEKITHLIITISILQLLYYNHIFDFRLKTAGLILIVVMLMNLIFKADKFSFIINLIIGSLTCLSLWITKRKLDFSLFYFSSYILITFFSFYIKFYIQKREELLSKLANQAPGALYQYQLFPDGSSRFPYSSKGIYEIYETKPVKVVENAEKVFNRIHPDDYDQVVNSIQESADNLDSWHDKYRVILPKQGEKWIEGNAKPEEKEDGSVLWHGNLRDITKDKEMEMKIKEQKDKLSWVIKGTNAGTWEWNIQTGKTYFNERWAEMLGYNLGEI